MTTRVAGGLRRNDGGEHWVQALGSLAVGIAFFALWFWLLPKWLAFHPNTAVWRWIAAVPSVLGFAVALRCVWDFGWTGRGTPAPIAPPKRLVVVGFYRYVRNPMYVGFVIGWVGLWIVFGRANLAAVAVAALVLAGVALFVSLYEEPTLRKKFGSAYDEYCTNVPRWLPRWRPGVANGKGTAEAVPTQNRAQKPGYVAFATPPCLRSDRFR